MQTRKGLTALMGQFVMVGQLGLSLIMPLLICLFFCHFLVNRYSMNPLIYILGFFFGLGGSCMTAYKVYKAVMRESNKTSPKRKRKDEVVFNVHY